MAQIAVLEGFESLDGHPAKYAETIERLDRNMPRLTGQLRAETMSKRARLAYLELRRQLALEHLRREALSAMETGQDSGPSPITVKSVHAVENALRDPLSQVSPPLAPLAKEIRRDLYRYPRSVASNRAWKQYLAVRSAVRGRR